MPEPTSTRQDPTDAGFRPDIEGLRAVAIVAVLLCHAGLPFFAGGYVGVDVFFVISGFLITRLLLGELERTGRISLRRFYARRAKRLLPLSARPPRLRRHPLAPAPLAGARGRSLGRHRQLRPLHANWHFAAQSVDYFAQDIEPSPVLHLWSLAIEEQFYVVWPTLLLAVTWLWRRRGDSVRPALWVTLAVVLVGSFALGVQLTDDQPAAAYFSTFGRAWELGLGAALALLGAVRIRRARRGRDRLGRPRRDRLRRLRLRRDHALPRDRRPAADPRHRLPDPRRRLALRARQGGPRRPALARAGPLRRPHLLLLVPVALAGADLRRRDLGARSRSPPGLAVVAALPGSRPSPPTT